ncbi:hypothetical protein, partial [Streptococcus suis]
NSSMAAFNDVVAVYLGVQNKEHFPKMKDSNGLKMKDENGRDRRSKHSDGYTHTFSEVGTSKVVKVVLPKSYNLELMTAYKIGGLGYDISSGNMIFIEKNGTVAKF